MFRLQQTLFGKTKFIKKDFLLMITERVGFDLSYLLIKKSVLKLSNEGLNYGFGANGTATEGDWIKYLNVLKVQYNNSFKKC